MSALGQKQTSEHIRVMSALPPKADIHQRNLRVIVDGQSENVGSFEVSSCAMGQKSRVTILHDWLVMAQLTPTRREKTNG